MYHEWPGSHRALAKDATNASIFSKKACCFRMEYLVQHAEINVVSVPRHQEQKGSQKTRGRTSVFEQNQCKSVFCFDYNVLS